VRVPLLRIVRLLEDSEERLTTLYEVDTPPQGWNPPKPASWAALESLRAADVEPIFADGLQECSPNRLVLPFHPSARRGRNPVGSNEQPLG